MFAQGVGIEAEQVAQIGGQVAGDDGVFVAGVPCQRGDKGGVAAGIAEHAGDVHQRGVAGGVYHGGERGFTSVFKEELEQARLFLFDEFGDGDGGVHVGERVVGVGVFYAVGGGELFQAEYGQAVFIARPFYALGAQGVAGADDVEQVPAGVAVLVAVFVGVEEVAVEGVAGDFVVVTDVVVAHDAGVGLGKFGANPRGKFGLGYAFLLAFLRGDACDEHGFG